MESNKVADEVRMKLTGKAWCGHCQMEVKPGSVAIRRHDGADLPTCPNCYCIVDDTKPEYMMPKHTDKET